LANPVNVAVDAKGVVYVADTLNHRIRRIGTDGIITTFAGGGSLGDGVPATQASLIAPTGVAVDVTGFVYIADWVQRRIRRVSPDGIITTTAEIPRDLSGDEGILSPGFPLLYYFSTGVAIDARGLVYIADASNHRIYRIGPDGAVTTFAGTGEYGFSGDGGPAVQASLRDPSGVTVDARGNVYIADTGNGRIRRVGPDGAISTFAGTGKYSFSGDGGPAAQAGLFPTGVAIDAKGNVYVADYLNHRIRRVEGGGPRGPSVSLSASFLNFEYTRLGTSAQKTFTVSNADSGSLSVTTIRVGGPDSTQFKISPTTLTVAEGQSQVVTVTFTPTSMGLKSATLSIYHNAPGSPSTVSLEGVGSVERPRVITTVAGGGTKELGDGGPATQVRFFSLSGVAADDRGNIYIADYYNNRVRRVGSDGVITTLAGTGPEGFSGDGGPAIQARLHRPNGVAVDANRNVYITDGVRVRRVGLDGIITTVAGTGEQGFSGDGGPATQARLRSPRGVAVDIKGNLYIADILDHRVRLVSPDGIITTFAGTGIAGFSGDGGPAAQAQLNWPTGVAVDAKGNVYIADTDNHRIRRVGSDGVITTLAGMGTKGFSGDGGLALQAQLNRQIDVAVDTSGSVYIADAGNNRVRLVSPDGIITTFAGTGRSGFSGDGGLALQARLNPVGVAVDVNGNVYIIDVVQIASGDVISVNSRIRRMSPTGPSDEDIPGPISLDLDPTPGDQQVRTQEGITASQKIQVELVALEKALGAVGFSARIEYDTLAVSYVSGSFKPGTMFSGNFVSLVRAGPGFVEVGGTTLGGGGSAGADRGTLGAMQFEAVKGFRGETRLILTNVVYNRGGGRRDRFELRTLVKLNVTGGLASDFDGDGEVGFADFFLFAEAFGQKATGGNARFDLDGDGEVDFDDFFAFAEAFGKK
jgi:sugar lactone lactonase YvrE